MKKKIAILLLAAVLCLTFAGCTLDSYRQSQVFYNKEGNVTWKGHEYILLDESTAINPLLDYENYLYATDTDVPLLLQQMYGERMLPSLDERFLLSGYSGLVYCRSDYYEQYNNYQSETASMDRYCYCYADMEGNVGYYCLTDEETDWINGLLISSDAQTMSEDKFYEMEIEWIVALEACSEDLLVRSLAIEIYRMEDTYYFRPYDENDSITLIQVPAEETETLEALIERTFY